jgi:hypothetical protein
MLTRCFLTSAAVLSVALGWYQLIHFSSTPGAQFAAPAHWPGEILLSRTAGLPLLLVFVHPRCSCTPATLRQLDSMLQSTQAAVQVALVVYGSKTVSSKAFSPDASNPEAPISEPAISSSLLHVQSQVVPDPGGLLARRFGAATSGEIVLYAADGHLLFQGGITPMRSQVGAGPGADALSNALTTGAAQFRHASVFGCPIFLPGHAG